MGYTFGTGFGVGVVIDNRLNRGDNSCVETFCLRHKKMPEIIVEDGVSVRAVKRVYGELSIRITDWNPGRYATSPMASARGTSGRRVRLSPKWARSPATPWPRP